MANRFGMVAILAASLMLAAASGLVAQNVEPAFLNPGQTVSDVLDAQSARLPDGTAYACYAVSTAPGDQVTVTLRSSSFDPALRVVRGALCANALLQHENDDTSPGARDARITFQAAGGRYLVLARAEVANAGGAYDLTLEGGRRPPVASPVAADRSQIMAAEVGERRAELAAAEAARLRQQAEAAAVAAEFAEFERQLAEEEALYGDPYEEEYYEPAETNVFAGVLDGFARGLSEAAESNARLESMFDDTNRMIAQRQAEEAQRQASQARAAEQARLSAAAAARAEAAARAAEAAQRQYAEHQRSAPTPPQNTMRPSSGGSAASGAAPQQCTTEIVRGSVRSNPRPSRSEAEAFVRNTPTSCPGGARAPLRDMTCDARQESVIDSSCLTSLSVCPKREVWVCTASYTCEEPLRRCVGGGASRQ